MDKPGSGNSFGQIIHFGLIHDLQPGAVSEGQKVGTEAGIFVVVHLVGNGIEILDKEGSCPLQIGNIHSDVFNFHKLLLVRKESFGFWKYGTIHIRMRLPL